MEKEIERLKNLLGRYANHVAECEGVTFIDEYYTSEYLNDGDMKEIYSYFEECEK